MFGTDGATDTLPAPAFPLLGADQLITLLACDHHRCGTAHPPPAAP
jgi:hypothetical protein